MLPPLWACACLQATLQRPAPLTVQGVLGTLRSLAREKGQGAAGRRQRSVLGLLRACRESETKYLTRTLVQVRYLSLNCLFAAGCTLGRL